MRCFIFLPKKKNPFERNIRKSLVFDLKIMILHRGRGRGQRVFVCLKTRENGWYPKFPVPESKQIPWPGIRSAFNDTYHFCEKNGPNLPNFLQQVSAGSQNMVKDS
jgi:hypothetical protein